MALRNFLNKVAIVAAILFSPIIALAQVTSGGDVALQGTYVEIGVSTAGWFGIPLSEVPPGYHVTAAHNANGLGFIADYRMNGWVGQWGGDYFTPGTPYEGFAVEYDTASSGSVNALNGNAEEQDITSTTLADTSSGNVLSALWTGDFSDPNNSGYGYHVEQQYSFNRNDLYFVARCSIKNTGTSTLKNLRFARIVDPDNDETWPGGSYTTDNKVVYQASSTQPKALVTATGTGVTDMVLGLGTFDTRAVVSAGSPGWMMSPDDVINNSGTTSVRADETIGLAFVLGDLAPGDTVTFDYAYVLSAGSLDAALGNIAGVTITSPSGNISGTAVPFEVTTNDTANTSQVKFYVGGELLGTVGSPMDGVFGMTFDSTGYPDGPLDLSVTATINGVATTNTTTVTVDNDGPPIAFSTPAYGAVVIGSGLPLTVVGTKPADPPVQVTFTEFVPGLPPVNLGTVTTAPFTTSFNTNGLLGGTEITLQAVSLDGGGNQYTISTSVYVSLLVPTFETSGGTTQWVDGGTPSVVDPNVEVAGPTMTNATVAITSGFVVGDVLGFVNQSGITGSHDATTGVLTLAGSASASAYQAALATVTITSSGSTDGVRTVTFSSGGQSASKNTYGNGQKTVTFTTDGATGASLSGTLVQTVPYGGSTTAVVAGGTATFVYWVDQNGTQYPDPSLVLTNVTADMTLTAEYEVTPTVTLTESPASGPASSTFDFSATVTASDSCAFAVLVVDGTPVDDAPFMGGVVEFYEPGVEFGTGPHAASVYDEECGGPFASTQSNTVDFTVADLSPATFAVGASPNPAYLDSTVNLTVTLTGSSGLPTGTATFLDGTNSLCPNVALSGGSASCPASGFTAGNHSITVSYSGDGNYEAGTSPTPLTLAVQTFNTPVNWSYGVSGGGSQQTAVGTAFAQPLEVKVVDGTGQPISGIEVDFSLDNPSSKANATLSSASATTNSSGVAQITATANNVAGSYLVDFHVIGLTYNASTMHFSLQNVAGAPATLVLSESTASTTVALAFASGISAVVTDSFNNPVTNALVNFSVPSIGASATLSANSIYTDATGTAAITATANHVAGTYNLTVSVGTLNKTVSLTNLAGAAVTLAVSPTSSPQSALVGGGAFAQPLTVTVEDTYTNVVSGVPVTFSATPVAGATATLSAYSAVSAVDGTASVTAQSGNVAGGYLITATASGLTATFSLTNTVGIPASLVVLTGGTQNAVVNQAFGTSMSVEVEDSFGNGVPSVLVSFSAPASGATAVLSTGGVTSGSSGQASITATAGTVAGSYTVTASAAGVSTPVAFNLTNAPGVPATLTLATTASPQSAQVGTAYGQPLALAVTDAYGNAVPNATVTYGVPSSGASAKLSGSTDTTNSAGMGAVTATANLVAGSYQVTASVTGVSNSAVFALNNLPGSPSTIAAVSGTPQQAVVGAGFSAPLVVRVLDANNNAVPNVTVTFAAPSSGAKASLSAGSAQTAADGTASVTATAGTVSGPYLVSASASGTASSVQFALTNLPGVAASVAIVASTSGQSTRVGNAFAQPLTVLVTDSNGNPVPNVTVAFACPASGSTCTLAPSSAVTNAQGNAQVTATAGSTPGGVTVSATVTGLTPANFTLTDLVGLPGSIAAVSGSGQTVGVYQPFGSPLVVVVKDSYQNPVPLAAVSFSVSASGPQGAILSESIVNTDVNGEASVNATANQGSGAYTVSASASGVATPASFGLTNTIVSTTLTVNVDLPVFSTVITTGGTTHVTATVGPQAGGQSPTGSIQLTGTRPLSLPSSSPADVTESGNTITAPLSNGAAQLDIVVDSWMAQDVTVAYVPDSVSAETWTPVSETAHVNMPDHQSNANSAAGCSAGGGGPLALVPMLLLLWRRRRGQG